MGDLNSKTAGAINDAIFLMLGCIGLVLGSLAGFAIYLMKRAGLRAAAHDSNYLCSVSTKCSASCPMPRNTATSSITCSRCAIGSWRVLFVGWT